MMNWLGNKNEKRHGVYGCGRGLVHIIKHHHWPHFLRKLTHHNHHKRKRLLSTRMTNDTEEEQDKLIVVGEETLVESAPRKSNSIKARMRALLAEEMKRIKGRQRRQSSDLDPLITHQNEPMTEQNNTYCLEPIRVGDNSLLASHPKEYLDALGIISANEEFLVNVLHDPGSPLAHHFRSQQALSAKMGILVKSETFPLPGSSSRERRGPRPSRLKPKSKDDGEDPKETRVVIKRFKDLKHKLKHVIGESKKEMHRVTMDAVIHKIPRGQDIDFDNRFKTFETSFEGKGYESDFSDHSSHKSKPIRLRGMRRASSFNESLDRYRQLYETSFNREVIKHQASSEGGGLRRMKLIPKHFSRIYSLPDLKAYDIDQNDESSDTFSCTTRNSLDGQTSQDFPMESIVEEEEDSAELYNHATTPTENDDENNLLLVEEVTNDESGEQEEEEEVSSVVEVSSIKDKAEFSYVKDVLELSGFSGEGFVGTWHSDSQPVNPSVYEEAKRCLTLDDNEDGDYCCETLLFDLINEVLMEIYGRSYSYYPFPLSYLSRTTPMPIGQHVLTQVWGLISFYLSLRNNDDEVDQTVDSLVAIDFVKSANWWMNLQFDCECVGLELEDMIFHDLLEQALSD